MSGIDVLKNRF